MAVVVPNGGVEYYDGLRNVITSPALSTKLKGSRSKSFFCHTLNGSQSEVWVPKEQKDTIEKPQLIPLNES